MHTRLISFILAATVVFCQAQAAPAQPQLDMNPFARFKQQAQQQQQQPISLPTPSANKGLPRTDYPFAFVQPVPLKGVNINGLSEKTLEYLGFNYFVTVDNTPYTTMTELYRENRLRGKGNIVTADCVIHPYVAFTNRVLVDIITRHTAPELEALLKAMLHVAVEDYRQAQDREVQSDIERNIAFLTVGIKLMEPGFLVQPIGHVPDMVSKDLAAIQAGGFNTSASLDESEDFSAYRPLGWYSSTPELAGFYKAREWVSRMAFPLTDTASSATHGSSFRRSVLIFRCLDLSKVGDQPAYTAWQRLLKEWALLGTPIAAVDEKTISPQDYKSVLKDTARDMKVTLQTLAEPLFRTKLMLSMRKQKPQGLGATSIFEIGSSRSSTDTNGQFRLMPVTGDPEIPWLRAAARVFKSDDPETPPWPLALADLHAWGAGEANNVLSDLGGRLDTKLFQVLPELDKCTTRKIAGQWQPLPDRRWNILSGYFNFPPEAAQQIFRTETWMVHKLESAFGGWVDGHLAVAPPLDAKPETAAKTAATDAALPPRRSKEAPFHYLEPAPEIFKAIATDAADLEQTLTTLGFMTDKAKERFDDFARLGQRLQKIAESELKSEPVTVADQKLLGNIDMVLEKVDLPISGNLALDSTAPTDRAPKGVNFSLGRPGQLYIILKQGDKSTLARGGVYTYFETPGGPISDTHWQRKVEFAMLKPPYWADKFDVVQQAVTAKKQDGAPAQARPENESIPEPNKQPVATKTPAPGGRKNPRSSEEPIPEPTLPNEPGLPWYNPMMGVDN